jgi:hypothetical protein
MKGRRQEGLRFGETGLGKKIQGRKIFSERGREAFKLLMLSNRH